ncbi:MAG: hypothetical protein QOI81_2258 [Actinomycetota bacterium]|jgi:hypothetical protein|nr:hypothetical protein [Actinomycetota bacterium]
MAWINDLASALGVEPLSADDEVLLLDAARDVAHGVERRITPLATFLMGAAVERARADGLTSAEAMTEVLRTLADSLPTIA